MSEIVFSPDGMATCVHTDDIDLRELGFITSCRATSIEWSSYHQQWEVKTKASDVPVFRHHSRKVCIDWEIAMLHEILRDDHFLASLPQTV